MDAGTRVSLRDAAEQLGVHYQTAYRWVRQGLLPAVKMGGSYEVEAGAIEEVLRQRSAPVPPPVQRRVRDWQPFAERLERFLLSGDEAGARDLIEDLVVGGLLLQDVCDRLMVPALAAIGQKWHDGEISIAAEHRASTICERALGRWATPPPGRPRGVAVVCSPPSDEHALPGEMATAVLRENRWRVHHLGVGVPTDDIVALVAAEAAELVVISVTWPPAREEAAALAADLAAPGRTVLVGAPGQTLADLVEAAQGA